jgi:dihydrolipoamide dehydrogenase
MTEKSNHFDVAVLGSGPGGYAAAFRAADLGKKVALIEKDKDLGGVCLNRGCIPSKALLHIAQTIEEAAELSKKGVELGKPKIDLAKIRAWKEEVVGKLNKGIAQMAKVRKVEVFLGNGKFVSATEIAVDDGKEQTSITFDNAIIATGSSSAIIPTFPMDNPAMMTSKDALEIEKIPKSMLVIGGGYIGLEMASVYSALGTQITVVEMLDSILPGADKDIIRLLQHKLKKQFANILVKSKVKEIKPNKDKSVIVIIDNNRKELTESFEKVLVSVGRKPNLEYIGLEALDIKFNKQGFIEVDKQQKTNVPNIYAIGDITGNPMLAHKATHEGKVAAEVIAGMPAAFDAKSIPAVIFTNPEVAWTGLTENEAQEQGVVYEKAEFPWAASGKAIATGHSMGKTKILFDPISHKVLGVSIVGPHAGDIISEAALAIEMGADAEDIGLTIHPHPTLSETFANAAEVFAGTVTDLYAPKNKK